MLLSVEIKKFIEELGKEIKKNDNELQKEVELLRLQAIAKTYLAQGGRTRHIVQRDRPLVSRGQVIQQGRQLGIMGTTGVDRNGNPTSTGIHLHITFYFKNNAGPNGSDSFEIDSLLMEGRAIKDYKLSTTWDSATGRWSPQYYYQSTNTR